MSIRLNRKDTNVYLPKYLISERVYDDVDSTIGWFNFSLINFVPTSTQTNAGMKTWVGLTPVLDIGRKLAEIGYKHEAFYIQG